MKIVIINPPHTAIGSRMANEHLPPLGLLSIAGPLIDNGYNVHFIDADYAPMPIDSIISQTLSYDPDAVLLGHSGSTSAQPIINKIARLLKSKLPSSKIIIGGVFPTYHWKEILKKHKAIDYIVCGEGEN